MKRVPFEVPAHEPLRLVVHASNGKDYELTIYTSVHGVVEADQPLPNGAPNFLYEYAVNHQIREIGSAVIIVPVPTGGGQPN